MGFDKIAKSVVGPAGLLIAARTSGAVFTFLLAIIVARTLPIAEAGLMLTWMSAAMLATVATSLNMEAGSIRYLKNVIVGGAADEGRGYLKFVNGFTLIWGFVFAILVFLGYRVYSGEYNLAVAFFCASMPIFGLLRVNRLSGLALGFALQSTVPNQFVRPFLLWLAAGAAWLVGHPFGSTGLAAAFLLVAILTYAIQHFVVAKAFASLRQAKADMRSWRSWLATGLYFSPALLLTEHYPFFLNVVAVSGLGEADIARLNVVLRLMLVIALVEQGLLGAATSILAKAYYSEDTERLKEILGFYTCVNFAMIALGAIGMVLVGHIILGFFGSAYIEAWPALVIFTAGRTAFAATGPSVLLLNITGGHTYLMMTSIAAVVATALPLAWIGPTWGLEGIALFTSAIYVAWGIALAVRARKDTGLDTSAVQGWHWFYNRVKRLCV